MGYRLRRVSITSTKIFRLGAAIRVLANEKLRLIIPLILNNELVGFIALMEPRSIIKLNWEVRDLLWVASTQATSYLAQYEVTTALSLARQFESFNRMSTFVVHDIKNLIFQLSLLLTNAEKQKENPEFQIDMMETVNLSVNKMQRLLKKLNSDRETVKTECVFLDQLLKQIVQRKLICEPQPSLDISDEKLMVKADLTRLERVIGHLIQNAIEATFKTGFEKIKLSKNEAKALIKIGILMVFSFIVLKGTAQVFNSTQKKLYNTVSDTLVLDSLSLVPGSINFKTFPDSVSAPKIDYKTHALIFSEKKPDSILVSYKRFPYNFEHKYFHKDPSGLYTDLSKPNTPYTINYNNISSKQNQLFQNDGLNKNGNISRGISFGNNQDVVVNSNLNLQVSGKLTQEIDMVLAATDNNIPFQADGTTAQLQEFDKVYIQLNNASRGARRSSYTSAAGSARGCPARCGPACGSR